MQPFHVKIKNLGKLTDADIRISSFTVFAGANNTGKSFVSKALYSLFGAINANHLAVVFGKHVKPIMSALSSMKEIDGFNNEHLDAAILAVKNLNQTMISIATTNNMDEFHAIEEALPNINNSVNNVKDVMSKLKMDFENNVSNDDSRKFPFVSMLLKFVDKDIFNLMKLKDKNPRDFITEGLQHQIRYNFLHNFQIAKLSDLCPSMNDCFYINIDGIGKIINKAENVNFSVKHTGLNLLQKYSRVLYLESPIFWRMRNPLENVRNIPSFIFSERERITGVPKYFYDMADMLRETYSGEHICPEVLKKLTGDDVLGGKVAIGETGELRFLEKGKSYPLSLAATGVANLGMIALLIEKNLMDENTFLFIDEPEAHLHSAWQEEMAEALFALAKNGVNVVIATHSEKILNWLNKNVKNNPDAQELIALNHFCADGTVHTNDGDFNAILEIMKKEISTPPHKLHHNALKRRKNK